MILATRTTAQRAAPMREAVGCSADLFARGGRARSQLGRRDNLAARLIADPDADDLAFHHLSMVALALPTLNYATCSTEQRLCRTGRASPAAARSR
jgi:hypothetical protein